MPTSAVQRPPEGHGSGCSESSERRTPQAPAQTQLRLLTTDALHFAEAFSDIDDADPHVSSLIGRSIAADWNCCGVSAGAALAHAPLNEMCERISMVNGYVAMDTAIDEQSRTADLIVVDDHEVLWTEWAKFAAWRCQGRLAALVAELEFTSARDAVISRLEYAGSDTQHAIDEIRAGERESQHYGE